jgi:SAM-dependent methyltransferase
VSNPWLTGPGLRGHDYDGRWAALASSGARVHGEADFVMSFAPGSVLDAGCGTGRVAIELARRGVAIAGVDLDPSMLSAARAKAPELTWIEGDLASAELGSDFDLVVAAGNVIIFLTPGTQGRVVGRLAAALRPGGRLVAGFSLKPGGVTLDDYDRWAAAAGLDIVERWATWDRAPFERGGDYDVSVHMLTAPHPG